MLSTLHIIVLWSKLHAVVVWMLVCDTLLTLPQKRWCPLSVLGVTK